MNIKTRITLLPVFGAIIFTIGIAIVLGLSNRTLAAIDAVHNTAYPYLDDSTQFANQLEAMGVAIQSAVAEGEKKRLDEVRERAGALRKLLDSMGQFDAHKDSVARLSSSFSAYEAAAIHAAELILGIKPGDAQTAIDPMQRALSAVQADVKQIREEASAGFAGELNSARAGVTRGLWAIVLSAVVVIAALGLGSVLLIGNVWRQLGGEPEYARDVMRLMAGGDLSQSIQVAPGAEDSLLSAVRDMSAGLSAIVAGVRSGTDSITLASREIASGNHDLSVRTELQAGSLEQTSSSMQALTEAVSHSADAAAQAKQLAGSATDVARRGGDVVGRVVTTMDEINSSSKQISDIIGVIDGIAFQTNILALNAAVEAARAGEQGRGFAVVAGEVRSLAQRSAEAARQIKGLIGSSVERVAAGSRLVQDAGKTMDEIVGSVQRVTDIIGEISSATSEQSSGLVRISASVVQLDQMTQQNAALVEQAAAAASSLEQQAQQLQGAVATFKL